MCRSRPVKRCFPSACFPSRRDTRPILKAASISTKLRGEVPTYLVTDGGLAAVGSPVFNVDGKAVGFVSGQAGRDYLLHRQGGQGFGRRRGGGGGDDEEMDPSRSITLPPNIFVPSSDFLFSIADPPKPGEPLKLSWMGLPQLTGVE